MSSRRSTRHPLVPLPVVRQQVDDAERLLQCVLDTKMDIVQGSLPAMDVLTIDVKNRRDSYLELNRTLCSKLVAVGASSESSELNSKRSFFFKECQQFINLLNMTRKDMGVDTVSNPDWRSETSVRTFASCEDQRLQASLNLRIAEAESSYQQLQDNIEHEKSLLEEKVRKSEIELETKKKMLDLKSRQLEREKKQEALRVELLALDEPLGYGMGLFSLPTESAAEKVAKFVCSPGEENGLGSDFKVSRLNLHEDVLPASDMLAHSPVFSAVTAAPLINANTLTLPFCSQTTLPTYTSSHLTRSVSFLPTSKPAATSLVDHRRMPFSDQITSRFVCQQIPFSQVSQAVPYFTTAGSRPFSAAPMSNQPDHDLASITFAHRQNNLITASTARPSSTFAPSAGCAASSVCQSTATTVGRPLTQNNSRSVPLSGTGSSALAAGRAIDCSAQFLIRQELFKKAADPFAGEPHRFWTWIHTISNKISNLDLNALDVITVLEANTTGKPQKLVQDFFAASGAHPEAALDKIWGALHERFGSGQRVADGLRQKLNSFPNLKSTNGEKLQELADLCRIVEFNMSSSPELQDLNQASGMRTIWRKLPDSLQDKWRSCGNQYEVTHCGSHPPFSVFVQFLEGKTVEMCNLHYEKFSASENVTPAPGKSKTVKSFRIEGGALDKQNCVFHNSSAHATQDCKAFSKLSYRERKDFSIKNKLCFRCLGKHRQSACEQTSTCSKCRGKHHTLLHPELIKEKIYQPSVDLSRKLPHNEKESLSMCTAVCGKEGNLKSCSKTLLVDVHVVGSANKKLRCYALIDEQSNCSFADPKLSKHFGMKSVLHNYSISTLQGSKSVVQGELIEGLVVRGVGESKLFPLPLIYTNKNIPNSIDEVATPGAVHLHEHISRFASKFQPLDPDAEVLLLLGRDCGDLMATRTFGKHAPYVHHTALGWALVGSACLERGPSRNVQTKVYKTSMEHDHYQAKSCFQANLPIWKLPVEEDVFSSYSDDELPGLSIEDSKFLHIISNGITTNDSGNLQMPLPLKDENVCLPSNRDAVFRRTRNTLSRLMRDPEKLTQCTMLMRKSIEAGHVEVVPPDQQFPVIGKAWWLPVFPVVHPKKNKVRLVFDSSASYHGTSLNNNLLQGPDQNNRIKGVLLRFREGEIGFVADVETMYHAFYVNEEHRDFLRFFWFDGNDATKHLVQYRARVHIFGNRPSPSVAIYGLRHCTLRKEAGNFPEARDFIWKNFYVDDGLGCANTPEQAIKILKDSRRLLSRYNIHLHKIASSSPKVLEAFPNSEKAEDLNLYEFQELPLQHTLGIAWDVSHDSFSIRGNLPLRPFTKRGILSTVNSIFDPLGFVSPITLAGRLIQRMVIPPHDKLTTDLSNCGWDDPLPERFLCEWRSWKDSLVSLETLVLPRSYCPAGYGTVRQRDLHVFSDASQNAIGYVMYLRTLNDAGDVHVSFVSGNSKVAPRAATSIPRMELCAALEAASAARQVMSELNHPLDSVHFSSDSRVVLGYLHNQCRRFSRYVSRRVSLILTTCSPTQWHYISTDSNPADIASRPQSPSSLSSSRWIKGPEFLWTEDVGGFVTNDVIKSLAFENLPETELESSISMKTSCQPHDSVLYMIFSRVSSWSLAVGITQKVLSLARFQCDRLRQAMGVSLARRDEVSREAAAEYLIASAQQERFPDAFKLLQNNSTSANSPNVSVLHDRELPEKHSLSGLSPFIDRKGLLRVGGRLRHSRVPFDHIHPLLLPANHPVSTSILRHFHERTKHQGRHITHGAIRGAGYHLENGRQMVRQLIAQCVLCRKARAPLQTQKMADLPKDRLEESPPFTNTGMDVFGPFLVHDGANTRRNSATRKTWALLLTCLVSRAVHVEPLPSLDTTAFKNALRRFFAIRGTCKLLRSDRGTNFTSARSQEHFIDVENVQYELGKSDCVWILNPPGASHFGGIWERKIRSVRQALDATLRQAGDRPLSRDELNTLLLEAVSIVNNTPLWEVSCRPEDPAPLTPAMLLTLKENSDSLDNNEFTAKDLLAYGRLRWRRVQYLADQFWVRWRRNYFQDLQTRRKWRTTKPCIQPGDIVLVKDKNIKRNYWPMGRVTSVKLSSDGLVRSASLNMACRDSAVVRNYERSISDLVLLIASDDQQCGRL